MDIAEKTRLWNLIYHWSMHKYCEVQHRWIIRPDEEQCMYCNPDKPKCFVVGGTHDDTL